MSGLWFSVSQAGTLAYAPTWVFALVATAYGSESILSPSSAEARVNDVVEDRAESVAEPEAETRLVVGLELAAA